MIIPAKLDTKNLPFLYIEYGSVTLEFGPSSMYQDSVIGRQTVSKLLLQGLKINLATRCIPTLETLQDRPQVDKEYRAFGQQPSRRDWQIRCAEAKTTPRHGKP